MHVTALDEQLRMSEENVARLEKELAHTHREPLSKGRATQQLTETGRGVVRVWLNDRLSVSVKWTLLSSP